jgi:hypothetical protein
MRPTSFWGWSGVGKDESDAGRAFEEGGIELGHLTADESGARRAEEIRHSTSQAA